MAKKSSTNAVDKINKQINELEKNKKKKYKDDDVIPVFDREKINKEIGKKSSNNKNKNYYKKNNKSNKNNKKIRDNIIVNDKKYKNNNKDNDKTIIRDKIITVESKKKNIDKLNKENKKNKEIKKEEGLTEEETIKLKNLEDEMRDLYSSDEFSKTIKINTNTSDKNDLKSIENRIDEKLDDVSLGVLNKILYTLLIIFCALVFMFILFIVFISTF